MKLKNYIKGCPDYISYSISFFVKQSIINWGFGIFCNPLFVQRVRLIVGHHGSRCHTQFFGWTPWIAVSHSVLWLDTVDRGVTLSFLVGHRGSRCHTQFFGWTPWFGVSHSVVFLDIYSEGL
jgi:hypothetical protein